MVMARCFMEERECENTPEGGGVFPEQDSFLTKTEKMRARCALTVPASHWYTSTIPSRSMAASTDSLRTKAYQHIQRKLLAGDWTGG